MKISISAILDKILSRGGSKHSEPQPKPADLIQASRPAPPPTRRERPPAHIQIGFDFGTAFSKVVIRDVNARTARVFWPKSPISTEMPFLIPSAVYFGRGHSGESWLSSERWHPDNAELLFPKLALCAISGTDTARRNVLESYKLCAQAAGYTTEAFVENAVAFYMASVLSAVILSLRDGDVRLFENKSDWLSACVAIPTENLADSSLAECFRRCLRRAFLQANRQPDLVYSASLSSIEREWIEPNDREVDPSQCMLYPEVSANMVAYTQSRASSPGMFQMIDVGAGTVDVSFFTFVRNGNGNRLSNFSGLVSFCGSSRIESHAYEFLEYPLDRLPSLREAKEGSGKASPEELQALNAARVGIAGEVENVVHRSIVEMLDKLPNRRQIHETRFLFVGGGCCEDPYQLGTLRKWESLGRSHNGLVGIPFPPDLEAPADRTGWFQRLTVAYGLSFDPVNRPEATLPGEHRIAPPISRDRSERPSAPSKDEC